MLNNFCKLLLILLFLNLFKFNFGMWNSGQEEAHRLISEFGNSQEALLDAINNKRPSTVIKYLAEGLENNIDFTTDSGLTPLIIAAESGNNDAAEIILSHGADVDKPDSRGYTPLMHAAAKGHINLVEDLLHAGANKNLKVNHSITAAKIAQTEMLRPGLSPEKARSYEIIVNILGEV